MEFASAVFVYIDKAVILHYCEGSSASITGNIAEDFVCIEEKRFILAHSIMPPMKTNHLLVYITATHCKGIEKGTVYILQAKQEMYSADFLAVF
jgi:hypothetical protein